MAVDISELFGDRNRTDWVPAAPFRSHLLLLMAAGDLTSREVGVLAGVSPRATDSLAHGRLGHPVRRISTDHARRLLQLEVAEVRAIATREIPAPLARRHLHRLQSAGWTVEQTAVALGVPATTVRGVLQGRRRTTTQLLAVRAAALAIQAQRGHGGPEWNETLGLAA